MNGRLPISDLAPIGGGFYLRKDAARQYLAMQTEARRRFGSGIPLVGAYRTYASQVYFRNLYLYHGGNLAAIPGTSNHGWGLAIDLSGRRTRWIVDQVGSPYGWSKAHSDAPGEWWHIAFDAAIVTKHAAVTQPALRYRSQGQRVSALQNRLRVLGFLSVPGVHQAGHGFFGKATVSAIKRFQHAHKLKADGVVGAQTTAALVRAVR